MANVNASILEIAQKYLACLSENGIVVNAAYLFGSCARVSENKWSDVDIAVIASNISDDRFEDRTRFAKLSSAIDSRIEPVPFRPDTFVDEDPLVWEIKKAGIIIKQSAQ